MKSKLSCDSQSNIVSSELLSLNSLLVGNDVIPSQTPSQINATLRQFPEELRDEVYPRLNNERDERGSPG